MKILVIGASGLVGGALHRALERAGMDVVGTSCTARPAEKAVLDIRQPKAVQACVEAVKPQVVILAVNVAGGVDYCQEHPDDTHAILVEGTRYVAEQAARHHAMMVHYSTDYIFDGTQGPYTEEEAPFPLSVYGRAKLEAERAIQALVSRHLILRTTAVFGWDRRSKNFAMQVWQRLQAGRSLQVPQDQWCNPTLVDYLAEASARLLQMGVEGLVNVVGHDRVVRVEFAQALAKTMLLDPALIVAVPTAALGQVAPRPVHGGLHTDKLSRLLGTEPPSLA